MLMSRKSYEDTMLDINTLNHRIKATLITDSWPVTRRCMGLTNITVVRDYLSSLGWNVLVAGRDITVDKPYD
jgi:hypothetical protein